MLMDFGQESCCAKRVRARMRERRARCEVTRRARGGQRVLRGVSRFAQGWGAWPGQEGGPKGQRTEKGWAHGLMTLGFFFTSRFL